MLTNHQLDKSQRQIRKNKWVWARFLGQRRCSAEIKQFLTKMPTSLSVRHAYQHKGFPPPPKRMFFSTQQPGSPYIGSSNQPGSPASYHQIGFLSFALVKSTILLRRWPTCVFAAVNRRVTCICVFVFMFLCICVIVFLYFGILPRHWPTCVVAAVNREVLLPSSLSRIVTKSNSSENSTSCSVRPGALP